jgi:DNA-binding IclR family transcriptional regulator
MARILSQNTRKLLTHLGNQPKSLDELAARTGLRKDKVAKLLWHLERLGWVAANEETRRLAVYRRLRDVPAVKRDAENRTAQTHIAALNAAFGIRLPAKRARGRTVRRSE